MKSPERIPLGRRTADILEVEIQTGRWPVRLPGYRSLCSEMNVSRKTMESALKLLTRRKVVLPAEGKLARKINPNVLTGSGDLSERKSLLVLSSTPFQKSSLNARNIVGKTSSVLTNKGWIVNFEYSQEYETGDPGIALERLLAQHKNHRWLLICPSFKIIKWCMERNLRIICLGGEEDDLRPPIVSVSINRILSDAVTRLSKIGHRRICALVNYSSDQSRENVISSMEKAFASNGVSFHPVYNLPKFKSNDMAALRSCLSDLFNYTPPSSLIVTDAQHLITIYAYCMENGLRIPQDLSVIVTLESEGLDWFYPQLSHYELPIQKFVEKLSQWIEHYPTKECEHVLLNAEFVAGGSIKSVS